GHPPNRLEFRTTAMTSIEPRIDPVASPVDRPRPATAPATRLGCVLTIFLALVASILTQPQRGMNDFDQSLYITIAYDLELHGVFSNGVFGKIGATKTLPQPGMFFAPVYPALIAAMMKMDSRFAEAVRCEIEA